MLRLKRFLQRFYLDVRLHLKRFFRLERIKPVPRGTGGEHVDALIESINESSKQVGAVTLTFLATIVYLAITAGSTTHEQLLLDSPLTLPLFNVGVPAKYFYCIAPTLIVFLHLTLLLQEYFLAYRVYRLPEDVRLSRLTGSNAVKNVKADTLFVVPSVIMRLRWRHNGLVRSLLRLVFLAITVVLPVVVLILIQVKFLPYHDRFITKWFHRGPIFADLFLIWFFFLSRPKAAGSRTRRRLERIISRRRQIAAFSVLGILTALTVLYSLKVAAIPESCTPSYFDKLIGYRSLRLIDRNLAPAESSAAAAAAYSGMSRGVRLSKRDLRCANFARSTLVDADFRSSNLAGANFLEANLQGADFSPLGTQDRRRSMPRLAGIGVTNPFPEDVGTPTRLDGANFTQAKLRRANFRAAQLGHAHLENSDLVAADFSSANLDGARLAGALLVASDLKSASLRNADLQGAQMQGANLAAAKAEYAVFLGASLEGADLSHISATGAEFVGASLQGAIGLPLAGVDLRNAKVARVSFYCGNAKLRYADLRDLDFEEQPWFDPKALSIDPSEIPLEAKARLEKAKERTLCFPTPSSSDTLYSRQRPQDWPESQLDADSYFEILSAYLMHNFCFRSDEPVRLAMAKRVLNRLTVNPEDALAKKLVRLLRQEILSPECDFNLDGHEDIKRGILRRIELLEEPLALSF